MNTVRPRRKILRRPNRSAARPPEKEEAGEGQRVGVDDPLQARRAEVQVALNGRQGDVDDRRVQDHHELADADEGQHQPGRHVASWLEFDRVGCSGFSGHRSPSARDRDRHYPHRGANVAVSAAIPTLRTGAHNIWRGSDADLLLRERPVLPVTCDRLCRDGATAGMPCGSRLAADRAFHLLTQP